MAEAKALSQASLAHLQIAATLANEGLRALAILNGGAAVALFTLLGQGNATAFVQHLYRPSIVHAFCFWAAGLVCTMTAYILAWWSQQSISTSEFSAAVEISATISKSPWRGSPPDLRANGVLLAAAVLVAMAVVFFGVGCAVSLKAALDAAYR